jgi:glycosyltransferase involved in cell wall biosynthesis
MQSISVALCTYNGCQFLAEQLASLRAQTCLPSELVVCDDYSTDDTLDIVRDFATTSDFPVRVFRNETRLGYRRNFMKAARLCNGELIAFCDQDDIWLPNKLEVCAALFKDPRVVLVVHDVMITDQAAHPTGRTLYQHHVLNAFEGGEHDPAGEPWPHFHGLTQVFKRELIDDNAGDRITDHLTGEVLAHDQVVPFVALERGRIEYTPVALALYRQHEGNVAGVRKWTITERIKKRIRYLRRNGSIEYSQWSAAARDRSRYLTRADRPSSLAGPFAKPAIAQRYSELARLFELRAALYSERSVVTRTKAFVALLRMGAYTNSDRWHLPAKTRLRDLVFGLILHPLLQPPTHQRHHY